MTLFVIRRVFRTSRLPAAVPPAGQLRPLTASEGCQGRADPRTKERSQNQLLKEQVISFVRRSVRTEALTAREKGRGVSTRKTPVHAQNSALEALACLLLKSLLTKRSEPHPLQAGIPGARGHFIRSLLEILPAYKVWAAE